MINFRSDAHISKRRAEQARVGSLNSHLKKQYAGQAKAHWQIKTDKLVQKQIVNQRMRSIKQRQDANLNQRRQKLAILLSGQEEIYQRQLMNSQETPEQVREKMYIRLQELKSKREGERMERVQSLNDKRFKQSADELRLQDSVSFNQKCRLEQENQMLDKMNRQQQEIQEEELYALLWKQDMMRKVERQQLETQTQKKAIQDRLKVLEWQRQQLKSQQVGERAKIAKQQAMLQQKWIQEEENEKKQKEATAQLNKARNLEIIQHNQQTQELRRIKNQEERMKDKEMVMNLLEKEKKVSDAESKEKQRLKEEAKKLMNFVDNKAEKSKLQEKELEEAINKQAEEQFKKQARIWQAQADARANLMRDVYNDRDKAVNHHQSLKDYENNLLKRQKDLLEAELKRELTKEEEERLQKALQNKSYQGDLLRQQDEKDKNKRKGYVDDMYVRRAQLLAEKEYRGKIDKEKDIANSELQMLRQQRPF